MLIKAFFSGIKDILLLQKTVILEILDSKGKTVNDVRVELFPSSAYICKSFSYNKEKKLYELTFVVNKKISYRIVIIDKELKTLAVIENLRFNNQFKESSKASFRNSEIKEIKLTFEEKTVKFNF